MKRNIFSSNGSAIELQNCAEEASQLMHANNARVREQVDAAVKLGAFVVVEGFSWHCRSTDAVVGEGLRIHSTHASREEAMTSLNDRYESGTLDTESSWTVYPVDCPNDWQNGQPVDCSGETVPGSFGSCDEIPF